LKLFVKDTRQIATSEITISNNCNKNRIFFRSSVTFSKNYQLWKQLSKYNWFY